MRSTRTAAVAALLCLFQTFPAAQARGHVHARTLGHTGVASWYGWRENGRLMANGHRFHALGATAASRTLPFGTRVKVTNLRTHRSAWVTIADRGPGIRGRMIDLSLGTARVLGMERKGLDRVSIRPLVYRRRVHPLHGYSWKHRRRHASI